MPACLKAILVLGCDQGMMDAGEEKARLRVGTAKEHWHFWEVPADKLQVTCERASIAHKGVVLAIGQDGHIPCVADTSFGVAHNHLAIVIVKVGSGVGEDAFSVIEWVRGRTIPAGRQVSLKVQGARHVSINERVPFTSTCQNCATLRPAWHAYMCISHLNTS